MVTDTAIFIGIGIVFNYLVIYKKNPLLGNIIFFGLGLAIASTSTAAAVAAVGVMITLSSVVSAVLTWKK